MSFPSFTTATETLGAPAFLSEEEIFSSSFFSRSGGVCPFNPASRRQTAAGNRRCFIILGWSRLYNRLLHAPRSPFSSRQDHERRHKSPQDNRDSVDERSILQGQFFAQVRPRQKVDIFESLQQESDNNRGRKNGGRFDLAIRQQPINEKQQKHRGGNGGEFEHDEPHDITGS